MTQRPSLSAVLVVVGIVLLVTPALFPVQQLRFHETRYGTIDNRSQLERQGATIIAYEDLSERGKTLYVEALRHEGAYAVPKGAGAPDFDYGSDDGESRARRGPDGIVIERPENADLPPADEPVDVVDRARERARERAEENPDENVTTPDFEQKRKEIARYDVMRTYTDSPPLTATPNLLRLFAALGGVLCIGVGGYRHAKP